MAKRIPLTQGQFAVVCDCHAYLVDKYKWCAVYDKKTKSFRAARNPGRTNGKSRFVFMHKVINNTPAGMDTDHENRDSLDNRCSNLRNATRKQNMMNKSRRRDNKSGYKGVYWNKRSKKWHSQIRVDGKLKHLGFFENIESAARAYDFVAKEIHGEFAVLNF